MLGAFAAVASAALWAYASTRYALASRAVGSARVNLTRSSTVLPLFLVATLVSTHGHLLAGISGTRAAWLALSVLCAYGFADNLFFAAARRVGVTTALAIASSYPLWAALLGTVWRGERFGVVRAAGTLLCVGGIIALIALSPRAVELDKGEPVKKAHEHARSTLRDAREGILLALLTSVLWAGNTVSVKLGGTGIDAWHANLIRFLIAWPILAATSALVTRPTRDDAVARAAYRGLIVPSLLEAFVGSSLFVYGLAHTDLAVGATLSSLAPLLSVPFALFYGEERWSPPRFAAVTATVAGVIILIVGA
ncbi:MAG TPA: DMT family transporter, partial [Polyangia bacterium]|nr:DMT family transporter [Polyangia bacterium]